MPKVIDLPTATTMDDGDYFIVEESSGGTKKITRANAVTLASIGQYMTNVSASSSITLTIPSGYRGTIFLIGPTTSLNGIYNLTALSSGSTSAIPLVSASDITITTATNSVTISNGSSSRCSIYGINHTGTAGV